MASYQTSLTVPQPVAETFAFVSDFRNAARWDPRTFSAEKTTDGPIAVGTRFVLRGGMLTERVVERLHIPRWLATLALPYDVVEFDSPNSFSLEGETRLVRYADNLSFSPDGAGTRVTYAAELHLKGPLAVGEPLIRAMFRRIGDEATLGLPEAVVTGA